jgi:hypothetical protein
MRYKTERNHVVFILASGEVIARNLTHHEAKIRCRAWNKTARMEEWASWRMESREAAKTEGGVA